jgi:hypothetical protein
MVFLEPEALQTRALASQSGRLRGSCMLTAALLLLFFASQLTARQHAEPLVSERLSLPSISMLHATRTGDQVSRNAFAGAGCLRSQKLAPRPPS